MAARRLSFWVAFEALFVMALMASIAPTGRSATVVDVHPTSCGSAGEWLCYGFNVSEDPRLWTTFDQPQVDVIINPLLPDDRENWRIINVYSGTVGSVTYSLLYPSSQSSGGAYLGQLSFLDASGASFFNTGRALLSFCREVEAGYLCSEGNSVLAGKEFGEVDMHPFFGPPDATLVPDMFGPSTIRIHWQVYGDTPLESSLRLNQVTFGFALAPIPEPSTAVLMSLGLALLARLSNRG